MREGLKAYATRVSFTLGLLLIAVIFFLSSSALALLPGHTLSSAPVVSPSEARAILEASSLTRSVTPLAVEPAAFSFTQQDPEIKVLARGLKYDVDLIYQFVHNHIRYSPIFGSLKGPRGTLLDRVGNDFDQASLMIALLKESDYEASYVYGTVRLYEERLRDWLGIDPDPNVIGHLLGSAGIPAQIYVNPDGSLAYVIVSHVWVKVNIEGTDYVFDPSIKEHFLEDGIDLAAATGYDKASFTSQALSGATEGSDFIQNINKEAISSALTTYSSNLVRYIRQNMPAATLEEVIGGGRIIPSGLSPLRQTSLPYQASVDEQWTEIPDTYRTSIRIQHLGIDQSFFTDEIYGRRLTIFYNDSSQPELRLDGQLIATGDAATTGSYQDIVISVDHPYAANGGTYCDDTRTFQIRVGGSYLVVNGWAETTRGMVERHRRLLKESLYQLGDEQSEPVLGESLAMIAYTWLSECSMSDQLMDRIGSTFTIHHHMLGVCGQNESPYIDMPMCLVSVVSANGDQDTETAAFFAGSGHHSAFEWGVIDQLQPFSAVSTVKLIDIANSEADKLFDTTSSNFSSISSQLLNYNSYELSYVQAYINAGYRVILPQNGNLGEDDWTGIGFLTISPDQSQIGHIISGGLSGGYGTSNQETNSDSITTSSDPGDTSNLNKTTSEPIDLVTGDYLYAHTDLKVGSGQLPFKLSFRRHYNSSSGLDKGPLGLGWVHNLALTAQTDSDGFQGLGEDCPVDAAGAIVECMVSLDLLKGEKTIQSLVLATLSHRWFMDQLIHNIVEVKEPGMTSKFLRLPDGTFNPPQGVASSLTERDGGGFVLRTRHGNLMEFGPDGNILSWTDPNGNAVSFTYDNGKLVSVSNGMGRSFSLTYDENGHLARVSDQSGRQVDYTYDENGHLTDVTDPAGFTTHFEYDEKGRILCIYYPSEPDNPYVTNTYDELGHVATQTNANGYTYTYYFSGFRSEEMDPLGHSKVTYFDDRGKTIKEIDQLGNITSYEYDGQERIVTKIFPEENYIKYQYDQNHNLIRLTQYPKPGFSDPPIVDEYTYDLTFNKPISHTDPLGRITTFEYDEKGNLIRITRPATDGTSPVTTFTYNEKGQLLSTTNPTGIVTAYSYDGTTGDLVSVTRDKGGLNITTQFAYDQTGNLIQETDPLGRIKSYQYDLLRRTIQITDPLGYKTRFTYDPDGHLLGIEVETGNDSWPWQTTIMTYTLSGQLASITDPEGHVTTYEYDALDRKWKITDTLGHVTETLYDPAGRIWKVIDPAGYTEKEMTYRPNGTLSSLKDANGNITTYEYDGFDRAIRAIFPDGSHEDFAFDAAGNLTTKITRAGQTITFNYDDLDRLISKVLPDVGTIQYNYDLSGRLTQVTDSHGTIRFNFDSADRLVQVTYPDGKTISYQYDLAGNRTRLVYPDGYFVTYNYDALNRLTQVLEDGIGILAQYSYDVLSRRVELVYGNGTSTSYSYETDDDISQIIHDLSDNKAVTFNYTYNEVGDRTGLSVNDDRFIYKPLDNLQVQYQVNILNQYTSVSGVSFTYDQNGNLTSDGHNTYSYDSENRLISAVTPDHNISYVYDALGRRIEKLVDGKITRFLYDSDQVIVEYDGSGQELRRFVYGPGIDEPICMITSQATFYYHFDALGSVVALSDQYGNLLESYSYSPYGIPSTLSAVGNPYYFTGRRFDPESGLYYYRARYYGPTLGRFLQVDPIGYAGGMNLYVYVGNNPINWIDPEGQYAFVDDIIFSVGGAVVAVTAKYIVDTLHGHTGTMQEYIATAIGGAVTGEALLYTGPVVAGALGGATTNLITQWQKHQKFDVWNFAWDTGIGALTGLIPGVKIPGITLGRNSYNAIFKQMVTKFLKGYISRVSVKTALKMFIGRMVDTALIPGTLVAAEASFDYSLFNKK